MLFEIFAFFGIVIALLAAMAELGQKPFFGIAASVLLLILSLWVALDSIQFAASTQKITTGTSYQDCNCTEYVIREQDIIFGKATLYDLNETTTTIYSDVPEITPAIESKYLIWLVLFLVSIYGMLSYAEDIRSIAK